MEINRCFGCMAEVESYPCSNCGYDPEKQKSPDYALRPGAILNGKYLMGRVLGQGGFGITYVGWDLALERKVAIKEYFPSGQVSRHPSSGNTLQWYETAQSSAARQSGMEMFLKEARKMSRVDRVEQVVRVRELFQENDTAYIVMDFIEGETLKSHLAKTGPLSWESAKKIFLPVIRAMAEVHKVGLIHRDVSPDNLMLEPNGGVKILDLGAAKDLKVNSGASSMMVAKGGFSPLEQYTQRGGSGTWTDVYAMAATMYYSITGVLPPTAVDRMEKDSLRWDLPQLQVLPKNVIKALQQALIVPPQKRTQTMEEFERQLAVPIRPLVPVMKLLIPLAALLAVTIAIGAFALKDRAPVQSKASPSTSAAKSTEQAGSQKPDEDWEETVDALIKAGTQDVYNYRNGSKMELYFNGADQECARVFTNAEGTVAYIFKACYDDSGNLLEEKGYDGTGTMMRRDTYVYNADGKVLENRTYGENNKLLSNSVYTYDKNGREESWTRFEGDFRRSSWSTTTYDASGMSTETGERSNGDTFVNRYDADGNCVEYYAKDASNKQKYRGTYRYDSSGNEIEFCYYDENNKLTSRYEYEYSGDRKTGEISHYFSEDGTEDTYTHEILYGPRGIIFGKKNLGEYPSVTEDVSSIQDQPMLSFSASTGDYKGTSVSYYDWDRKYIGYKSYNEDGLLSYESVTHYDASGAKTGSTGTNYNNYNNTKTVTEYDADYNVISKKTYDASGELIESK